MQKRWIKIGLAILAIPVGLVGLSVAAVMFNLPLPTGPDWLYDYQSRFSNPRRKGDQLVGGGYMWAADGRGLWIRFRVQTPTNPSQSMNLGAQCTADQLTTVSTWFQGVVQPPKLLGFIPLPDPYRLDRQILSQPQNLQCVMDGPIESNHVLAPPKGCANWILYDRPSRYFYQRYGCYN
jgi:hypothetical protein